MPSSFLIIRRPPRSTLFPSATLFRSRRPGGGTGGGAGRSGGPPRRRGPGARPRPAAAARVTGPVGGERTHDGDADLSRLRRHGEGAGDRKRTRLKSSHAKISYAVFFFNNTATTEIYTLSQRDALPISAPGRRDWRRCWSIRRTATPAWARGASAACGSCSGDGPGGRRTNS